VAAFDAIVRDLSTTGLFVVTSHDLTVGADVTLALQLPDEDVLAQAIHRVAARVVRRAETGYGMLLREPSRELVDAIARLARR